jgi:hypothetical protein
LLTDVAQEAAENLQPQEGTRGAKENKAVQFFAPFALFCG